MSPCSPNPSGLRFLPWLEREARLVPIPLDSRKKTAIGICVLDITRPFYSFILFYRVVDWVLW